MPRIGLLSDSHGRVRTTQLAVDRLLAAGAEVLIHLGDVGSIEVIDTMLVPVSPSAGDAGETTTTVPVHIVFGNVDWDMGALSRYAASIGFNVQHPMGWLEVDGGKRIAFTHGDHPQLMRRALEDGADYLLHGHSHQTRDERVGDTRVINPGALFRAPAYSAAILDPQSDEVTFLTVEGA